MNVRNELLDRDDFFMWREKVKADTSAWNTECWKKLEEIADQESDDSQKKTLQTLKEIMRTIWTMKTASQPLNTLCPRELSASERELFDCTKAMFSASHKVINVKLEEAKTMFPRHEPFFTGTQLDFEATVVATGYPLPPRGNESDNENLSESLLASLEAVEDEYNAVKKVLEDEQSMTVFANEWGVVCLKGFLGYQKYASANSALNIGYIISTLGEGNRHFKETMSHVKERMSFYEGVRNVTSFPSELPQTLCASVATRTHKLLDEAATAPWRDDEAMGRARFAAWVKSRMTEKLKEIRDARLTPPPSYPGSVIGE